MTLKKKNRIKINLLKDKYILLNKYQLLKSCIIMRNKVLSRKTNSIQMIYLVFVVKF